MSFAVKDHNLLFTLSNISFADKKLSFGINLLKTESFSKRSSFSEYLKTPFLEAYKISFWYWIKLEWIPFWTEVSLVISITFLKSSSTFNLKTPLYSWFTKIFFKSFNTKYLLDVEKPSILFLKAHELFVFFKIYKPS